MNFKTTEPVETEINLTPLIDVVFLLLIFFMVTTTFQKDSKIKIELPTAQSSRPETPENVLELLIDGQGRYYINKKEVVNSKPETLFQAMNITLDSMEKRPSLIIAADANANYQSVITAMDIAARLELKDFSLATSQSKREK
ncbi:MAG: Biopolymer transport protein ExbD/TolR [uncultured Thiotrichaceae bacterium]|uniref:Biopolymer transport protein ExbD/TolR n=1 Tax=uncultured Thiotrichaceae bacterium TaxID=298394 RepID=A0A6S6T9H1_9GAMM|nr:MAG: Biopolymer transport protein ExbD/TolR [uncultured Thiotrichaceae bacterium]